jgi:flagellar assembly protein FliH
MFETIESRLSTTTIHPLEYRPILNAGLVDGSQAVEASAARSPVDAEKLEERIRELEQDLAERKRSYESGLETMRREGVEEGRASERGEQAARMRETADALSAALADFKAGRDSYLTRVEHEVVRLALALAARILHREALMDPLLLAGAVRVALGQLADTTEVRLKVPEKEHAMWSEMLRLMPNLPLRPHVISDETLTTGECLLETHLGSVDLGVRSQLAEIERGFFDLLDHRERRATERERMSAGDRHAAGAEMLSEAMTHEYTKQGGASTVAKSADSQAAP